MVGVISCSLGRRHPDRTAVGNLSLNITTMHEHSFTHKSLHSVLGKGFVCGGGLVS